MLVRKGDAGLSTDNYGGRNVSTHEERIAREEEFWTTPKLIALGLSFLTGAIIVIYGLSWI